MSKAQTFSRLMHRCSSGEEVKTQLQFNLNDVNFVVSWPGGGNGVKSLGAAIVEDFALHSGERLNCTNANLTDAISF